RYDILKLRLVKESRIIQISGKMLIASNRAIVGEMKSKAVPRSDRPRVYLALRNRVCTGVCTAMRSMVAPVKLTAVMAILPGWRVSPAGGAGGASLRGIGLYKHAPSG